MAKEDTSTTRFRVDISELKTAMQEAKRQVAIANSEFKAASASMDDWTKSSEGLQAKLDQLDSNLKSQNKILDSLQEQYNQTVKEMGEGSAAAERLKASINNQKAVVAKTEKEIAGYKDTLKDVQEAEKISKRTGKDVADVLDEMGEKAEETEGDFTVLKGALAEFAGNVLTGLADALKDAVGYLLNLAGETREFRTEMSKLETAFTSAGLTTDQATGAYKDLYAVLGDEGQAVEAANFLAKLCDNEEELANWTTIATGVYGTFGASLPIESLTEAANETAKTGSLTGALADALNWAGVSEDDFQKKLDGCTSEQERQALITDTLNGLYSDAAAKYEESAGSIMDANRAQAELTASTAALGGAVEPVATSFKLMGVAFLNELLPGVEQLAQGFMDLMNGVDGAEDTIGAALGNLVDAVINKVVSMLPQITTIGVSLITTLVDGLVNSLPKLLDAGVQMITAILDGVSSALPKIIQSVVDVIPKLLDSLLAAIPQLIDGIISAVPQILSAISSAVPQIIESVVDIVPKLITALLEQIPTFLKACIDFLLSLVEAVPTVIDELLEAVPDIIDSLIEGLLDGIDELLNGAIKLLTAIINAIPKIIPALIKALPQIIDSVVNGLIDSIPILLEAAIELFMALIAAIPTIIKMLIKEVPHIVTTIVNILKTLPDKVFAIGKNIVTGIWNGIKDKFEWVKKKISGFVGDVVDWFKQKLGIHSPSVVAKEQIGKNIALGIAKGIEKYTAEVKVAAAKSAYSAIQSAGKQAESTGDTVLKKVKTYIEKLEKLQDDYAKNVKKVHTDLASDIEKLTDDFEKNVESLWKSYDDAVANRANSLAGGFGGIFDAFASETENTTETLLDNMKSQLVGLTQWSSTISKLSKRIESEAFMEELRNMGVDAAADIALLNQMTDAELQQFVEMWELKMAACNQIATTEMSDMKDETALAVDELTAEFDIKLMELNDAAKADLKELKATFKTNLSELVADSKTELAELAEKFNDIGKNAGSALADGIKSQADQVKAAAAALAQAAKEAANMELDIHSPSRVFRNMGGFVGDGFILGINDSLKGVTASVANMAQRVTAAAASAVGGLSVGSSSSVTGGVAASGGRTIQFNQTINSPKQLDKLTIYRQTKNLLGYVGGTV